MTKLKFQFVSDLHGFRPKLTGGDILIVGGDHFSRDCLQEIEKFCEWMKKAAADYVKVLYIAGNHDKTLDKDCPEGYPELKEVSNIHYLCDSSVKIEGMVFYGTPHSLTFFDINPSCAHFTGSEKYMEEKLSKMPKKVDVLITHSPPYGVLDENYRGRNCGSHSLKKALKNLNPALHVFGHIHEKGGRDMIIGGTRFVNSSYCDERYRKHQDFPFI